MDRLIRDKDAGTAGTAGTGALVTGRAVDRGQEGLEQSTGRLQEQLAKARLRLTVSWLVYVGLQVSYPLQKSKKNRSTNLWKLIETG